MPVASVWHGDATEGYELRIAIAHNCVCEHDDVGRASGRCGAHRAMLDQRFLDGILFARRLVTRLLAEEWLQSLGDHQHQ